MIDFSLANAKLKGDGGDYRVRYIVDDEEMKWIDRWEQVVLTGWTAGQAHDSAGADWTRRLALSQRRLQHRHARIDGY